MNIPNNVTPKKRGVIYGRVSTNNESQKESISNQVRQYKEYAESHNINIIKVYDDVGSGTSVEKRKNFTQLMNDAELGLFDVILTRDISRWSRDNAAFLTTIRRLKELNITLVFCDMNMTNFDDELTLSIFSAVAQKEAMNTRAKTKSVRRYQIEHGAVPAFTYGYHKDAHTGPYELHINEEEAKVVRFIFEQYANGAGSLEICRMLKEKGIKTTKGNDFVYQSIYRILHNKIYIGIVQNNKQESLDGRVEVTVQTNDKEKWLEHQRPDLRIVSDELFYKCKEILEKKAKKYAGEDRIVTGWNLPFSRVLTCGKCGRSFRRRKNKTYTYFKCATKDNFRVSANPCGNNTSIREDDLYQEVRVYLIALLKNRANAEKLIKSKLLEKLSSYQDTRTVNLIQSEIDTLKKKKTRAMTLYIDGNNELKPVIDKLSNQISKLELELINKKKLCIGSESIYNNKINSFFNSIQEFVSYADMQDINGDKFNKLFKGILVNEDGHLDIILSLFGSQNTLHTYSRDESVNKLNVIKMDVGDPVSIYKLALQLYKQVWTRFAHSRTARLGIVIHDMVYVAI